ncbi:hypothetical protein ACFL5V_06675 [Fibrobacterota bacterium]
MFTKRRVPPSIFLTKVIPTAERPGSEGTYIIRLSPGNLKKLSIANGSYVRISYGTASVLGCTSVDDQLDEHTLRMDQTLRQAVWLEKIMQGKGKKELEYKPDGSGDIEHPVSVRPSAFKGPTLLARLLKQQYLMCLIHHAMSRDSEKPLAR